jgi:hypothetical protein
MWAWYNGGMVIEFKTQRSREMDEREKRVGLHGFWESAYKRISEYQGAFFPQWLASHPGQKHLLLTKKHGGQRIDTQRRTKHFFA